MRRQQLYLAGVAVDMPSDDIKIKVESNILNKADKAKTAHSYTATLPRTLRNDALFCLAYAPCADTAGITTHTYIDAALYIDGAPLFENGKAVVTKVDGSGYSITLFFGLIGVFDEIKAENLKLCDLPLSSHWDERQATWITLTRYGFGYPNIRRTTPAYQSGMTEDVAAGLEPESEADTLKHIWTAPYISALDVLAIIASVYGITWDFSSGFESRVTSLNHPLSSMNLMCDGEELTCQWHSETSSDTQLGLVWGNDLNASNEHFANQIFTPYYNSSKQRLGWSVPEYQKASFKKLRIHGSAYDKFILIFHKDMLPSLHITRGGVYAWSDDERAIVPEEKWGRFYIDVDFDGMTYTGNLPKLYIPGHSPGDHVGAHNIVADIVIDGADDTSLEGYGYWCFERNLPSLTVIEYLNELLAHCGAFIVGSVTQRDAVRITTYDEVFAASPNVLEITGVNEIEMSLNDLAQNNVYSHVENDDDGLNYDGSGVVVNSDTTLAFETEAFSSKFKVPRSNFIKQWEVTIELDTNNQIIRKAKFVKNGNVICGRDIVDGTDVLCNTGQDFEAVIGKYYAGYCDMVNAPKVIEVGARLTLLELLAVDMEKTVYIEQLGRAYAIVSIDSNGGDDYKLKLIQLP